MHGEKFIFNNITNNYYSVPGVQKQGLPTHQSPFTKNYFSVMEQGHQVVQKNLMGPNNDFEMGNLQGHNDVYALQHNYVPHPNSKYNDWLHQS